MTAGATGASFPGWDKKTAAIVNWVSWAARAEGDFRYTNRERGNAQPNEPYFELHMRRLLAVGVPEVLNVDLESDQSSSCYELPPLFPGEPRAEVVVTQKELEIDLHVFSFDQDANQSAWAVLDAARDRMWFPTGKERYLGPAGIAVIELFQVLHMPSPIVATDNRFFSEAVLEMKLSTAVARTDESAVGTWIENCLMTGRLSNIAALNLDDEPMGKDHPPPFTP